MVMNQDFKTHSKHDLGLVVCDEEQYMPLKRVISLVCVNYGVQF